MPTRSQRIRQAVRGGPIDKLRAEVQDLKEQVKETKQVVASSHMIHSDGTYSNARSETTYKRPAVMGLFKTKSGSQYQVMDARRDGAYVYPCPYDRQPRVEDCDFWTWLKIQQETA
jgi:hypothetical protein